MGVNMAIRTVLPAAINCLMLLLFLMLVDCLLPGVQ